MRRLSALCLAAVALVVLLGMAGVPGPAVAGAQSTNGSAPTDGEQSFSETQFVVEVYENGSARWTQRYNQPLSNATEVQQFRAYAERFNSEETSLYTDFKERASELTDKGANATGREMRARTFTRTAEVTSRPSATGVVEMSFLWTNFAATEDGRVVLGDAFESGLYLSPEMSLEVRAGPGLEAQWDDVEPEPDASTNGSANESDSLTWFGETQFASGQPRIVFVPGSLGADGGSSVVGDPMVLVAGAFVLAVVVGMTAVRRSDRPVFRGRSEDSTASPDAAETVDASTAESSPEERATSPAVSDEELQSDDDRVRSLLEANGGRMRQVAIVKETGWSKSKVSMLLSEMAEEGAISKLRVGRENIVSLDGHEPEAAKSPFDDG